MFSYSRSAMFPQIPRTQDVLYALQLSDRRGANNYYSPDGAANWGEYIANTLLVAAAVACRVLFMERYSEAAARKIIAEAIIELCPMEAKCLFNDAYVEAKRIAGYEVPSPGTDREALLATCECPGCAAIIRERNFDASECFA